MLSRLSSRMLSYMRYPLSYSITTARAHIPRVRLRCRSPLPPAPARHSAVGSCQPARLAAASCSLAALSDSARSPLSVRSWGSHWALHDLRAESQAMRWPPQAVCRRAAQSCSTGSSAAHLLLPTQTCTARASTKQISAKDDKDTQGRVVM